ncbi:MAG: tRNA (adenosine(37)-N6)-threonylcarbamoyltransferase complex ATPase subunit type 1 TsaE [Clostridia bacterium]
MEIITHDVSQTEETANKIAQTLKIGDIVALTGDLGAGKTAFTRGLAKGLGYLDRVTSPTFAIAHEYYCDDFTIFHFDMYRISSADELYDLGFDDYLERNGIMIIEWSENIMDYLPIDIITVDIKTLDENSRKITLGGKYENLSF